jgi:hypothetical protein
MKHLFSVSKPTLVKMMNSLFGESLAPETVEVMQTNSEFGDFGLELIRGDMFLRFRDIAEKSEQTPTHYHVEFQTRRDRLIGIRVFGYAFNKAVENERLESGGDDGETVLYMPKSLVIHIEQHEKIPKDRYRVKIIFIDENDQESSIHYTVPVLRYWEYDEKRLIAEKLYPLLPLQLFMLRSELEKMARRKNPQGKRETIAKIRGIAERVVREAHRLGDAGEISDEDIEKITTAIGELFKHLNDKYKADAKLNEEVSDMIKTLYDERVFVKGKQEGKAEGEKAKAIEMAKKMLLKKKPIDEIMEFTGLTEAEIREIEKTL